MCLSKREVEVWNLGWEMTVSLLAQWSFFELGSPCEAASTKRTLKNRRISSAQVEAAYRLHDDIKLVIGARFNKDFGRGRFSLANVLNNIMQLEEDNDASRSAIFNLASACTSVVEV